MAAQDGTYYSGHELPLCDQCLAYKPVGGQPGVDLGFLVPGKAYHHGLIADNISCCLGGLSASLVVDSWSQGLWPRRELLGSDSPPPD